MYIISPYTPLFFSPSTDVGVKSKYVQVFSPYDHILLQIVAPKGVVGPSVSLIDLVGNKETRIEMLSWNINSETTIYFKEVFGLNEGSYRIKIENRVSEPFNISNDVSNTVLIQASNNTNKERTDTAFFIDGMQYFFDFRIPGGFKDDDWSFGVDNEQYTTYNNDVVDVYSIANTQKTITIGNSLGCPVWFAEKVNLLLCSTFFYVDGIRYSRVDSSVPEMNVLVDNKRSYVFKQALRQVQYLDPVLEKRNQMIIRRTGGLNRFINQKIRIIR